MRICDLIARLQAFDDQTIEVWIEWTDDADVDDQPVDYVAVGVHPDRTHENVVILAAVREGGV